MGVRVRRFSLSDNVEKNQVEGDFNQENRETTVDGYTFHWAAGQVRNFLDEGVGSRHATQLASPSLVREDMIPFGSSRF